MNRLESRHRQERKMAAHTQDIEREIVYIVRNLPAQSAVEVRDFAQFLAAREIARPRIDQLSLTDWDKQALAIDLEQRSFESQHNDLLELYRGSYIAMVHGQVVDVDSDRLALRRRIREQRGDAPVLITLVEDEPIQTFWIRSPRLATDV